MKVIGWIEYDSGYPVSIGGLGGFFIEGMRWPDFIEDLPENSLPYYEALRQEIITKKVTGAGNWHQSDKKGTPLFEDNTVAEFSFRAWGDMLAAVWATELNINLSYIDFYFEDFGKHSQVKKMLDKY